MDSVGDYYTWSNEQVEAAIYSRFDRFLGNMEWFQDNLDTTLHVITPNVSNHVMLDMKGKEKQENKRSKFKFMNNVADMEGLEEVVAHN